MRYRLFRRVSSMWSTTTRATIASTASQEQRSSRPMLVLSIRCASQATTFSKSLVCRAFGRCPRHLLGADPTAGAAVDAVDVGFQPHLAGAEIQVPPATPGRVVAGPH